MEYMKQERCNLRGSGWAQKNSIGLISAFPAKFFTLG